MARPNATTQQDPLHYRVVQLDVRQTDSAVRQSAHLDEHRLHSVGRSRSGRSVHAGAGDRRSWIGSIGAGNSSSAGPIRSTCSKARSWSRICPPRNGGPAKDSRPTTRRSPNLNEQLDDLDAEARRASRCSQPRPGRESSSNVAPGRASACRTPASCSSSGRSAAGGSSSPPCNLSERDLINWRSGFESLFNACLLRRPPRVYREGYFGGADAALGRRGIEGPPARCAAQHEAPLLRPRPGRRTRRTSFEEVQDEFDPIRNTTGSASRR